MATSPFTSDERTLIHTIYGLPEGDTAVFATSVIYRQPNALSMLQPTFQTVNLAPLNSVLDAKITAASDSQIVAVRGKLDLWSEIETSAGRVESSGDAAGVLTDDAAERNNIRKSIGDILGFSVSTGGFMEEAKANYPQAGPDFGGR